MLPTSRRTRCSGCPRRSGDERRRHRVFTQGVEQNGPVHGLVAHDAGRGLGEIFVVELWHCAQIGTGRALFQPGGEFQHVGLRFERGRGEAVLIGLLGHDRRAAQLADGGRQHLGMRFVLSLEFHGHGEHRFFQQTRFSADLIGSDGLIFQPECDVENGDVVRGRLGHRPGPARHRRQRAGSGQPRGEQAADAEELTAAGALPAGILGGSGRGKGGVGCGLRALHGDTS